MFEALRCVRGTKALNFNVFLIPNLAHPLIRWVPEEPGSSPHGCRLHKPGFQNFGSWSERGGGAATAGGTAPCARSGRPPDLRWPAPGTYASARAKRRGRPRPGAAAKNGPARSRLRLQSGGTRARRRCGRARPRLPDARPRCAHGCRRSAPAPAGAPRRGA